MVEIENSELMCDVFKQESQTLREQLRIAQEDKAILISLLLKHKPELSDWIERNMK